jgi:hypothetical protein
MYCLTPVVLAALGGLKVPESSFDARMIEAPAAFARFEGTQSRAKAGEKALYGAPLEHHVDSENFSVQWDGDDATEAYAQRVAEVLEQGWQTLIVEQAWPQPVSADRYLLRVVLDPSLSGSGFTTTYPSDEYPEEYPVSYVSPGFGDESYPGYSLSVAVHEFSHMIQFAVRDWRSSPAEAWYWEASAEWMADQGAPEIDTYALSTYWYAISTPESYNSTTSYHQYGMLLLPRYIEDAYGPEVVQRSWEENAGGDWDDAIADATGVGLDALIPEMAGAYAAGALRESALFYTPDPMAPLEGEDEGVDDGELGELGSIYVAVSRVDAARFTVTGPATVRYATDGAWGPTAPEDTYIAAITRTEAGTIRWGLDAPTDDTADSANDTAPGLQAPDHEGCSCATGPSSIHWVAVLAITMLLKRRTP